MAQQEAEREKQRSQELEVLLERYRDRFGELPESEPRDESQGDRTLG